MVQVAKLTADFFANTSNFDIGAMRVRKGLKEIEGGFSGVLTFTNKLSSGYAALTGVVTGALAGGLALVAKRSIDVASAIKDTSDRLSVSTTELQKYQYAAGLVGLGNKQLEAGLTKLNAKLADGDLKYANTEEALYSIAEAVQNAKTGLEKTAIVTDAFGAKAGAKFIPFLEGLRQSGDEASRLGVILSQETIEQADKFGDTLDTLGTVIGRNFQAGVLSGFAKDSQKISDIYQNPDFAENIKSVGTAVGGLTNLLLNAANGLGILINKIDEFGLKSKAIDTTPFDKPSTDFAIDGDKMKRQYAQQQAELEAGLKDTKPYNPKPDTDLQKRQQTIDNIIRGLREENAELEIQTSMFKLGLGDKEKNEAAIARARKELQIYNQLSREGITITQAQKGAIDNYLDSIQRQTELQTEQENQQKRLEEQERNRQEALDQLGATFESAFEDAIVSGEKLSDVLANLFQDLQKFLLRKTVTEPLFNAVGDLFGGSSSAGGSKFSLNKLLSFLPSFDVGSNYVPYDMVANIHKGEMIIPAQEAAALRSGAGGGAGDVYHIDARGAAPGVAEEIRAVLMEVKRVERSIPAVSISAVKDQNRRNPKFLAAT